MVFLSQAATGNVFDEIKRGLHLNGDKETITNQFHDNYELLESGKGISTLLNVNQIYVQKGFSINRKFKEIAIESFRSGVETVNFANRDDTSQIINYFVEEKTNGKIKDLIHPDNLNPNTRLVLINAVYFKGDWFHKFDETLTTKQNFYISETKTVPVDFMKTRGKFVWRILDNLDATALEMDYANSNLSMIIVLPNSQTGLSTLENKFTYHNSMRRQISKNLVVFIPKFKLELEVNLNEKLKNVYFLF